MRDHWTAEEYREYQRTGKEPARKEEAAAGQPGGRMFSPEAQAILDAWKNPTPQEEIERRYAEAEKRGDVMVMDIVENPQGGIAMKIAGAPPKKEAKYRNKACWVGEIRFSSRHEARVYEALMEKVRSGELKCVCRQVKFDLPGGIRYFADFVVVRPDYTIEVIDAKSEITKKNRVYINKKKQLKALWGIDIVEM